MLLFSTLNFIGGLTLVVAQVVLPPNVGTRWLTDDLFTFVTVSGPILRVHTMPTLKQVLDRDRIYKHLGSGSIVKELKKHQPDICSSHHTAT